MSTYIEPASFSIGRAQAFITYLGLSQRYLFAADHRPSTNTQAADITQAVSNTEYSPWQQMIFGKAIQASSLAIRNIPYQFGVTYDQWDDQADPTTQQWYAIVNAGSYSHVFACLDNSNGIPSTVQPDFSTAIASDTLYYRASDGYKWMYLTTTDAGTVANLATADYFPLQVNSSVSQLATPGAIDSIIVQNGGKGYNNFSDGSFQSGDIKVGASPTLYQLSNSAISSANGFYQGCVLMITSGTGVGQFATINQYFVTSQGNFANISAPFSITPTNGSGWEVMPGVQIKSNGTQTRNVVARAIVNSSAANSVWRVEVLDRGSGYLAPIFGTSVVANSVVGVTSPASIRSILSPMGGHGYDVVKQLRASTVLIGCTFSNTESGLIPATNTYRQVGLLNAPLFANVQIGLTGSTGNFANAEPVDFMTLSWAASNATTNAQSVVISGDTRAFKASSFVYVVQNQQQFLGKVASITNSTSMNLVSNAAFSFNGAANLYQVTMMTTGYVSQPITQANVFVSNVGFQLTTGLTMYGSISGSAGTVSAISRNDVSKSTSTFVQLSKLKISTLGGSFVQNETVLQGNSAALVHSSSNGYLYLSNLTAPFVTGNNIVGNTSGATAQVTGSYLPELVPGSGQIEYLDNIGTPLVRDPSESESFIVAYQF